MNETRQDDISRAIREAVQQELQPLFQDLRGFVDRRIAELSAEVNGAVQMVDHSESNIAGQIGRLQEELARVLALPSSATRNSGLELEAVVQVTETAANRIMEAAESIGSWLQDGGDPAGRDAVAARVSSIFEACSFQDLTGQRIRRAIHHLQQVETMLAGIGSTAAMPSAPASGVKADLGDTRPRGPDLAQHEIDTLLSLPGGPLSSTMLAPITIWDEDADAA